MKIDVKIIDSRMADQLPAYATPGSAGLDLRACLNEPLTLQANAWQLVPTGIAIYLRDPNFEAKLIPLQKELAFIQMREGRPTPGDVAGVQNQLKRAYDAVVVPTQTAAPMQTRPSVLARPSMSGQSNTQTQAAPQTTLDIVRAARAQR